MADLENLLLEAAGRTNTSGRNRHPPPSRRRHEGSDSGSDSRDDDSDEDRGYTNRKPSGSQVPLKKRGPTERDDDQGSQAEGDYEDGASEREGDSSNESDDDNHGQMTELEREMMIFERDDKKVDKNLMDKFRSRREEKSTRSRKETPPLPSARSELYRRFQLRRGVEAPLYESPWYILWFGGCSNSYFVCNTSRFTGESRRKSNQVRGLTCPNTMAWSILPSPVSSVHYLLPIRG